MGLFDFFKKKHTIQSEQEVKWNKMWEMWVEEEIPSPYAELMTYQAEVNNGGHDQYFYNVSNTRNLQNEMKSLETILPKEHLQNLKKAYQAYLVLEEKEDEEEMEVVLETCDDFFYEKEEAIQQILEAYASTLSF